MGKASRQKRERRGEVAASEASVLLPSGEPVQPVRLYYTVENLVAVRELFSSLGCIRPDRQDEDLFHWYCDHEAAILASGGSVAQGSSLLGPIRLPDPFDFRGMMVFETHTIEGALAAAQFFAPRFPDDCRLSRCRMANLLFTQESQKAGGIRRLMGILEEYAVVSDPRREDARMFQDLRRAQGPEEAVSILAARLAKMVAQPDFPVVEDFALFPEEAAPPFTFFGLTLRLRALRALKKGARTEVDLTARLQELASAGLRSRPG